MKATAVRYTGGLGEWENPCMHSARNQDVCDEKVIGSNSSA